MLKGKTLLAYTAGIIDGEGSIMITRGGSYRMRVQVGMVEEYIPKWLHFSFGGSLQIRRMEKPKRNIAQWTIANQLAAEFLKAILPYLKIKRGQAEIALEFQSQRRKSGGIKGKRGQPFKTEAELAVEEAQFILMKNLKSKQIELAK